MYGKVKPLRRSGVRLSDREITQVNPAEGVLVLAGHRWSMEYVLTLRAENDRVSAPLLELFDARLIAMHNDGMLFRGVERPQGDDGPAYVQEWSVMIEPR